MSKSPSGREATEGFSAGDKDVSVECPTCGRTDFKSELGMKMHHAKTHNRSLCKIAYNCDWCGDQFEIADYNVGKAENHFCPNSDCMSKYYQENHAGENHPRWEGGCVEVNCDVCGKTKTVKQYRIESQNHFFCSNECMAEHKRKITGENHPLYKKKETNCTYCGSDLQRRPCRIASYQNQFCNQQCQGKWLSENGVMSGENNPSWKGGWDGYYGPNWDKQREKARQRDGHKCQWCGEASEGGPALPVHHLKRIQWFKNRYEAPRWWEKGNKLSNLVTLCDTCHPSWEGIPVRPQLI